MKNISSQATCSILIQSNEKFHNFSWSLIQKRENIKEKLGGGGGRMHYAQEMNLKEQQSIKVYFHWKLKSNPPPPLLERKSDPKVYCTMQLKRNENVLPTSGSTPATAEFSFSS